MTKKKIIIAIIVMINIGFCNQSTNDMLQTYIDSVIKKWSEYFKIEPALVKAICRQESQMKPYCVRFESHKKTDDEYLKHIPKKYRDNDLSYSSLGIMQVLYGTARWMGFRGKPEELLIADESIKYGCKYIAWLIKRYYYLDSVISSYNQGSPRREGNIYRNQYSYVNPVLRFYTKYGGKINIGEAIQ